MQPVPLDQCNLTNDDDGRALDDVLSAVHKLENNVRDDPNNAILVTQLGNELLAASKIFVKLGQAHESSIMQGRAADTYGRAAELNSSILRSYATSAALCTFQKSPGFRVIDDENDEEDQDPMDESSSEEEFDHAEHFYELVKEQYKVELSKHPENEKMRRRYDELRREHGDDAGARKIRRHDDW